MSRKRKGSAFVYVVSESADSRPVKIGIARWPERRLSELQIGNPRRLVLRHQVRLPAWEYAMVIETAMHLWFANRRVHGEWFNAHWKEVAIVLDKMAEIDEYDFPKAGLPELDLGWDFSPDAA